MTRARCKQERGHGTTRYPCSKPCGLHPSQCQTACLLSGTVAGCPEQLGPPNNWGYTLPARCSYAQPLAKVRQALPNKLEGFCSGEYRLPRLNQAEATASSGRWAASWSRPRQPRDAHSMRTSARPFLRKERGLRNPLVGSCRCSRTERTTAAVTHAGAGSDTALPQRERMTVKGKRLPAPADLLR